eukprot:gb/GEZN01001777.1/.p1 GENE.gb/GEZN01001777.1/~~gb/GEZN01001777.1/.p1  ORF type:complete len:679 (-),score=110.74 gb/GEZN01001777.1/:796-2580(-)
MFERASKKLGLDKAVLKNIDKGDSIFEEEEEERDVERMLKMGAYGLIEEDDNKRRKFMEGDIEDILKHNTRSLKIDMGDTAGSHIFSKMTFESDQADANIDVLDPEFWEKVKKTMQRDLLAELTDGTALRTAESRQEFWSELNLQLEKNLIENQDSKISLEQMIGVLVQFETMSAFPAWQRKAARKWLQSIEEREITNSKELGRGRSRKATRSSGAPALGRESDSEEEDGGRVKRRRMERGEESEYEEDSPSEGDQADDGGEYKGKKKRKKVPKYCCGGCFGGGRLLRCEGMCGRYFHLNCGGIERLPPDDERWECTECKAQTYACSVCREKGKVDLVGLKGLNTLRLCGAKRCRQFVHPNCAPKHGPTEDGRKQHHATKLKCSAHHCAFCNQSSLLGIMCTCVACSKAGHVKCLPTGTVMLSKKDFLCSTCMGEKNTNQQTKIALKAVENLTRADVIKREMQPLVKPKPTFLKSEKKKRAATSSSPPVQRTKSLRILLEGQEICKRKVTITVPQKKKKPRKKKAEGDKNKKELEGKVASMEKLLARMTEKAGQNSNSNLSLILTPGGAYPDAEGREEKKQGKKGRKRRRGKKN